MSESKDYQAFRKVLRMAVGNYTQSQFAKLAGISAEHLSRMLNKDDMSKPSQAILEKIAKIACNGITLYDLSRALNGVGNSDADYNKPTGNAADFSVNANKAFGIIAEFLSTHESVMYKTLDDFMSQIFSGYRYICKLSDIQPMNIAYTVLDNSVKYTGEKFAGADSVYCVVMDVSDMFRTIKSPMAVYISDITDGICVHGASMRVSTLFEHFGVLDGMFDEGGCLRSSDDFYACMVRPYYTYSVSSGVRVIPGKEMCDMLFGENTFMPVCIRGYGFYIDEIPDDFYRFLQKHYAVLMHRFRNHPEKYAKAISELGTIGNNSDLSEREKSEKAVLIFKSESKGDWITKAKSLIAFVMKRETGFPFMLYKYIRTDDIENLGDDDKERAQYALKYDSLMTKHDAVMLSDSYISSVSMNQFTVFDIAARYADELHLTTVEEVRYGMIECFTGRPIVYHIVHERKSDNNIDDTESFVWHSDEQPAENGVYRVRFEDGTEAVCAYFTDRSVWMQGEDDRKDIKEWCVM